MIKMVHGDGIRSLIKDVFGTDEDLYLRRQHSDNKTLDGLVDYTIESLYKDIPGVEIYSYGDDYGFFAVNRDEKILRSFGIKKQHRDKKELFWQSLEEVLGKEYYSGVWKENINAIRFFESNGGKLIAEQDGGLVYIFNKK